MKIIVCGGRDFDDYDLLKAVLNKITKRYSEVEIVHGACKTGADALADKWAESKMITRTRFHADWDKNGKSAGPIRNREMIEYVSPNGGLVAFWNGESKGTGGIIQMAYDAGIKTKVIRYGC